MTLATYATYIIFSLGFTIWVGRTLFKNGRIFILDSFQQDEAKADSINHLLLVGFYLVNFGFVSLFLSIGTKPLTTVDAIEYLSSKIGVVLVVLGAMHYFNMRNIGKMRSKMMRKFQAENI